MIRPSPAFLLLRKLAPVFAVVLLSVSCASNEVASGDAPLAQQASVVPVANVERGNISDDITVTAEFTPYQEIDVMAKVAGYIRNINVDIGDRVRTGQVLAQLEVPELQDDITRSAAAVEASEAEILTARDDLARARSTHDMAHLSYTRVLGVANKEPGLVPQQEVDEVHSKDLVAEAEVSAAQSGLQTAERKASMTKAEQARWRTLQHYTVITAPFSGVVTKRYANVGAMIQAGTASQSQAMPVGRSRRTLCFDLFFPCRNPLFPASMTAKWSA